MLAYSPKLTAAALGVVAVAAILSATLGAARLSIGRRIEAADGKLSAMSFEYFAGIAKLRAAAAESRAFANWLARYREFRGLSQRSAALSNLESVLLGILQPAAAILILYLAWQLAQAPAARALSVGEFVAFQAAMFGLLGGVNGIVSTAIDLAAPRAGVGAGQAHPRHAAGGQRARQDPPRPARARSTSWACPSPTPAAPRCSRTSTSRSARASSWRSSARAARASRRCCGCCWASSSRAAAPCASTGACCRRWTSKCLRARIGTVLQGGRLWAGDILANIVGATSLTVDDAWEAARAAGLAADIEAMPMGMYTLVGEGVSTLSGGQRQRVLIARALVGRPRILLLDEATSALDNLSQAAVLETLEGLDATRVVIAHRLSTVRNADRIVVLEKGRIVQEGTFRELAAVPGPFAAMLARQVA